MIISEIYIYPIKSCQGIKLEEAEVTPKGFLGDREFMLVDETGKFITQRQNQNLAKIKVNVVNNNLIFSTSADDSFCLKPTFNGQEIAVKIWRDDTIAMDQGDDVANWFKKVLQLDNKQIIRLVRQSSNHLRSIDINYAKEGNKPVSFADGYPFLLTNTASLADLNRRIQAVYLEKFQEVPMNRFRPNIVVETGEPFAEGNWQTIQLGEIKFSVVKPCSRCIITTTNQFNGERDFFQEPLKTLRTFRQFEGGIMFGENMIPQSTGRIKIGDKLQILVRK